MAAQLARGWKYEPSRLWEVLASLGLGAATVVSYCWALGRNGLGNPFYAAAVQAGSHSLHAAFFSAIDFTGTMSVDKPPASLWVMEVSVRLFGLNPVSELLPDAVAGVATTLVVVLLVREWSSLWWGLAAGAVSLVSPMANVMFRFNNPDGFLTLLTVTAVWCVASALRRPATWKLVAAGLVLGVAVLTKLLAGAVIVPVLIAGYLLWSPSPLKRRMRDLVAFAVAFLVSSGWWFVVVALTPSNSRPWIDGTFDNDPFTLLFVSNFQRLTGKHGGSVTAPGLLRMFGHEELPNYGLYVVLTLVSLIAVGVLAWRAGRWRIALVLFRKQPPGRAIAALFLTLAGGWLIVVMSYIQGGYHSYYAVIATPILAAAITLSMATVWHARPSTTRRFLILGVLLTGAVFNAWVWSRYDTGHVVDIVVATLAGVGAIMLLTRLPTVGVAVLLAAAMVVPGIYTWMSWHDHHAGGSPVGGPLGAQRPWEAHPPIPNNFNFPSRVAPQLASLLQHAGAYPYAVAMQEDEEAGSVQLATGTTVLPLTGWHYPPPGILERLQALVAAGMVHYFLPSGPPSPITAWVTSNFRGFTVGSQTLYDLTQPRRIHECCFHRPLRRRFSL